MRRVLLALLAAVLAVGLAWKVATLPGHVAIEFGGLGIEAPTAVAALALLLLIGVSYGVLRLTGILLTLPRRLRRWRAGVRRRQGDVAVTRALVALAAGEAAGARRESARARRALGDTPQTLLLAAQAGRLAGREDEADAIFRLLAAHRDAPLLGLRGLLQMAMARRDWSEAAALARRAEAAHPGAAWLREERARLAVRTGNWKEALLLAGPETPRAAFAAAAAAAEPDPAEALRLARRAWEADPKLTAAALAYATRLEAASHPRRARRVLRQAWRLAPHPDIAEAALAGTGTGLARLRAAETFLAETSAEPESHLLLARAALAAGLTGEARRHAEAARQTLNQRRVWMLIADIEEAEHGPSPAVRDALRHAATAEPDPAWRCAACGLEHAHWQPVCSGCGAAGRIVWEAAPAQTAAA